MVFLRPIIGLFFFGVLATAGAAEGIYRPVADVPRASPYHELAMIKHEGEEIAVELSAYCANVLAPRVTGDEDAGSAYLARRMLGVALLLAPRCRAALATDAALAKGARPRAVATSYPPDVLAQILRTRGELLQESAGATNVAMAGYFLAFAAEMNPHDEDAVYAWELHQLDAPPVDWAVVVGR